jgi:hypothetical protein
MSIWQKLVAVIAETEHSNRTIRAKGIEIATKTTIMPSGKKISRWWLHVDLLMQLMIKKDILDIKLRDRSVANKYHSEKCGHVGHMSKCFILIIAMILLKATGHKTGFLTQENHQSLNLVYLLTRYQ